MKQLPNKVGRTAGDNMIVNDDMWNQLIDCVHELQEKVQWWEVYGPSIHTPHLKEGEYPKSDSPCEHPDRTTVRDPFGEYYCPDCLRHFKEDKPQESIKIGDDPLAYASGGDSHVTTEGTVPKPESGEHDLLDVYYYAPSNTWYISSKADFKTRREAEDKMRELMREPKK